MVALVRPWNEPWKTMTLGRPVACRASLTAASMASAPELEKKKDESGCGMIGSNSSIRSSIGWGVSVVARELRAVVIVLLQTRMRRHGVSRRGCGVHGCGHDE